MDPVNERTRMVLCENKFWIPFLVQAPRAGPGNSDKIHSTYEIEIEQLDIPATNGVPYRQTEHGVTIKMNARWRLGDGIVIEQYLITHSNSLKPLASAEFRVQNGIEVPAILCSISRT